MSFNFVHGGPPPPRFGVPAAPWLQDHRKTSELAILNPPPLSVRKRFPWIVYWIVLAFIVLVALAPIGSVVTCAWIANAHGCKVDEGSVHPCIVNGQDYGQLLYTLGVLGWLMLVTIPGGAFAFAIWLIVLILHRERWRKRFAAGVPPPVPPPPALP